MTIAKRTKHKLLKPKIRKLKGAKQSSFFKQLNFMKGTKPSTRQARCATKLQSEVKQNKEPSCWPQNQLIGTTAAPPEPKQHSNR